MTRKYINGCVSLDDLRDALHYSPDTGIFVWKTSRHGRCQKGMTAGKLNGHGYRQIGFEKKNFMAHRLAWAFEYGEWPNGDVDHINRDKDDNRITNLRLATQSQNNANQGMYCTNTSGFKGVTRLRYAWQAQIQVNGKNHYLGSFRSKEDAARAYLEAAKLHFGEFANAGGPP